MKPVYAQHGRSEQLIAAARVVFALLALAVLIFEPEVAGRHGPALRVLAGAYVVAAVAEAWHVRHSMLQVFSARLATHAIDLAVATVLVAATHRPISPLFPLYIFAIFCATLRFEVRGVAATGAAVALLYSAGAVVAGVATRDPGIFGTRLLYVVAVTALLAYLRHHQQRMQEDMVRLASWPRRAVEDREMLVRTSLQFACALFRVPRAAIVFEEPEEPWLWVAAVDGSGFSISRCGPDLEVVPEALAGRTFVCDDVRSPGAGAVVASDGRVETLPGCPVGAELAKRLAMHAVLSAPVAGNETQGRLFLLDRSDFTVDDMAVSAIAGGLFAAALDESMLLERARADAVVNERLRLARDLHDTLLQSLTGMRLQLDQALSVMAADPAEAAQRIRAVQDLIGRDYAELRAFIASLRLHDHAAPPPRLATRLDEFPAWALQQWDLIVSMSVTPPDADVREPLATEVYRLVNEAVANAARHAGATRAQVAVTISPSRADVAVSDNGRGFPFNGTFDLAALDAQNRGPKVIRERLHALGGTLTLRSSSAGTTLEMSLPLR